jgi:hypothetical protein
MSMTVIEHIEVGSGGAAEIEFDAIPADYTDLMILLSSRQSGGGIVSFDRMYFNNSTSGTSRYLEGDGSGRSSGTNSSGVTLSSVANSATASTFANTSIYIPNYTSSNAKSASIDNVTENNATTVETIIWAYIDTTVTTAITSIRLLNVSGNWAEYSSATLYGIRKYDTAGSPKATGGIISFDSANNKWVHAFTASGTFTPTEDITCEYLVVAGGGGGP